MKQRIKIFIITTFLPSYTHKEKHHNIAISKIKSMSTTKQTTLKPLFGKENYMWMIIGGIIILLGIFIMTGGKNQDPNVFDKNVVYSTTRITVAPILILLGLCVEIFAIFKKNKVAVS